MPKYDRASGDLYRPGSSFQPHNAVKLLDLCDTLNLSVAGFLDALIEWLPLDETGRPVGWPDGPQEEEIQIAS